MIVTLRGQSLHEHVHVCLQNHHFISYCTCWNFQWSSIIGVSDWMNDIFSQSFASNLWNVSVRKENLSMYEIKTSYHGKCSIDFYSWVAMHQKTHLLAVLTHLFFLMHCSSWIKIVGVHFHGTISMIDAWKFSSTYN